VSATPHLHIEDSLGNTYSLPPSFFLADDPVAVRSTIKELLYGHGGRQVGDLFVGSRKVLVRGELHADGGAAFEAAYRALMNALVKGGKLIVSSDVVQRFIEVTLADVDSGWIHYPQYKRVDVTFDAVFPLWQDYAETATPRIFAGPTLFTVDLGASDHIAMPTIEVDADQGADLPTVKFTNLTDSSMSIQVDDPAFVVGDALVIDSTLGTVERNGVDAMDHFVAGAFLRLQPEVNSIQYDGGAATVTVRYRKVYV